MVLRFVFPLHGSKKGKAGNIARCYKVIGPYYYYYFFFWLALLLHEYTYRTMNTHCEYRVLYIYNAYAQIMLMLT